MASTEQPQTLTRQNVGIEYTWNAESVFVTRDAWRDELQAVIAQIPTLSGYQGRLSEGTTVLADFIALQHDVLRRAETLYFYASMSQSVDTNDKEALAMVDQAGGMFGRILAAQSFFDPELLAIGRDTLSAWMASEPRLAVLAQYVDNLFRVQAHVRSADVEELLGLVSEPLGAVYNTFDLLTNADMVFPPAADSTGAAVPVTQSTLDKHYSSTDRELRRTAFESYTGVYLSLKNTLAASLAAQVKADVFNMRARRYSSSLEAALEPNNISTEVFHNLINTYRKNLPTWHRYWAVRRRALGVDTLNPYDIWAPLTSKQPKVSFQNAVDMISEGLKPLGSEYVSILRRGCLEERWIDVYPTEGKSQGAFSTGTQGTHPFIMQSFSDDLGSMSTMAHELGHSMHSYFTNHSQPYLYTGYSLFVAEVASNFNQAMVRANLLKTNTDRDFQIAVIEEAMDNFHRYFFIMPTLARFELEMHQRAENGDPLTADSMISLMADLFSEGYGSEMDVDRDRVGITWATFPHLYANFYVFQYATGISAAHALSKHILAGEPGAAEHYLKFLSTGSSLYPIDALKLAGVDMTTPEAVESTFEVLAGYVDRLDALTR